MQSSLTSFRGSVDSTQWTQERLDSWKEVASFFRREVRTVQLWEKREGLPVRRQHHKKLGSIYAYRQELEAWWAARSAIHSEAIEVSSIDRTSTPVAIQNLDEVSDRCRLIMIPFGTIHSPLDRGPLREIIDKFAEGLTNDMVVELVRIQFRPVILPLANLPPPGHPTLDRMKNMVRELGSDLFLSGSIRYSGNQIRISVQMTRASDSFCLWSDRFDAMLNDILTVQADLAHRIALALPAPKPPLVEERARNRALSPNVAFHACSMGFHYWQRRGREALAKAVTYFQDAIDLEPSCADAHAGLADTYVSLSYNHLMPARKAAERAREAVDVAIKLDGKSMKVRNSHINLLIHCNWDLASAERECRLMIDGGVMDGRTLQLYSTVMNLRGRHQDAISLALHAYRLEPNSDLINGQVALAYFYAGDYVSALSFIRRTIDLEPQYLMGYALLGRTEAQLGNWEGAIAAFQRGLAMSPRGSFIKALLAYAYAGSGDARLAREILQELEGESHDECFPAYDVSAVHAILNQENEALKKIYEAYGTRDMKTIFVEHDPRFAGLRNSAAFKRITFAIQSQTVIPTAI